MKKTLSEKQVLEIAQRIQKINLPFELHEGQRRLVKAIFEDGKKRILVVAGRSWGKSAVEMYITVRMMCFPQKLLYIIGPTRKQQKEIMWEQSDGIKSYFPKTWFPKFSETENRIELPWQSACKIDGSENHQAYRGVAYDGMLIDEAQDMDARFYRACYPNLSKRNGFLVVVGTLQQNVNNFFMKLWKEAQADPSWVVINAPSYENEKIRPWLEEEKSKYYARGDEAEWIREFEARYAVGGNLSVFKPFHPDLHIRPRDVLIAEINTRPHEWEYWTVFDPGTKSVFAVALFALNRTTSQCFQLAEIYEKDQNKTTPREIWRVTRELEQRFYPKSAKINRVFDEAAQWFATVISVEFGQGLMPTTKDSRDKRDDIGVMKDAMLANKFAIAVECENSISEIAGWRLLDDGRLDENAPDHLIDCWRYFVRMANYSVTVHYTSQDLIDSYKKDKYGLSDEGPGVVSETEMLPLEIDEFDSW